jgi:hypothetical protein
MEPNEQRPAPAAKSADYEPPRVEQVLDATDLIREGHYAGTPGSPITPG